MMTQARGDKPTGDLRPSSAHGTATTLSPSASGCPVAAATRAGAGFGYFFNNDNRKVGYRYRHRAVDCNDHRQIEELRSTMRRLALVLERYKDDDLPPHTGSFAGRAARENPAIPAGYTYLMQLVSHDLVFSVSSLSLTGDRRAALDNGRSTQLRLQTIYGDGPFASPILYRRRRSEDGADNPEVFALRLGNMRDPDRAGPVCPMRDIARINAGDGAEAAGAALPDALVADERNDDHVIISQLTVLFHLLHNGLLALLARSDSALHAQDPEEAAHDRYFTARTAATLIYRRILRQDLLPRLLHPAVLAAYAEGRTPHLGPALGKVPLELTHGALRVGHAMVRDVYEPNRIFGTVGINELLHLSSARRPQEMPVTVEWAVQWSQFYDLGERPPLASMRLGPRFSQMLRDSSIFRSQDSTGKDGLAYRDLLSTCLADLWSVPALIEALAGLDSPLAALFRDGPLADDGERQQAIAAWLRRYNSNVPVNRLDETEIEDLAREPPLAFYLMFEALHHPDSRGLRLGPLASIIIADFFFSTFERDPVVPGEFELSLQQALAPLAPNYMGRDALADLPVVDSMSDLVRLVARLQRWETPPASWDSKRDPPFL